MDSQDVLKDRLFSVLESLERFANRLSAVGIVTEDEKKEWDGYLKFARDTISDSRFRIAVVGSVKSGKSTLINALLGVDLLKRGAGIVTAFVTRVLGDESPEAVVEVKPLEQISAEVRRIITGLAGVTPFFSDIVDFDIGSERDRKILTESIEALRKTNLSSESRRNLLLLKAYLEGYHSLEPVLKNGTIVRFRGPDIVRHREYVAQESHAVYVKNVELRYPAAWLGKDVEIADCQGGDAPNPLHYALLQDYLYTAHAIIYVINSRIGLREADFKLLDFIRSLSMMENTVFVLNVDIDVHPSVDDLVNLKRRVFRELALFSEEPRIYAFSALAELMRQLENLESALETRRLSLWRDDAPGLLEDSKKGFDLFRSELDRMIARGRAVAIRTGVARIRLLASSMLDFVLTRRSFLKGDLHEKTQIIEEIEKRQNDIVSAMNMVENMISGLRNSLVAECDKAIQRFFDLKYGPVVVDTVRMIENYRVDSSFEARLKDVKGLIASLYDFYMHFRGDLARFIVDDVNVKIMAFAKEQEGFVQRRLMEAARGFWALLRVTIDDYRNALRGFGIPLTGGSDANLNSWNPPGNVSPPNFGLMANDYVLAKGVLYAKYGLGRMARFWDRLKTLLRVRKADREAFFREDNFLEAVSVVKRQAIDEVIYAFRDYRQNFRFKYVHRLIDEGIASLLKEFTVRVETVKVNLGKMRGLRREEENKRRSFEAFLEETEGAIFGLLRELENIQGDLDFQLLPSVDIECTLAQASNPEGER